MSKFQFKLIQGLQLYRIWALVVSVLITVREGIEVAVVDERVVAISPGKLLGPDAEVVIRDKWRRLVLRGIRSHESRNVSENDHGASDEEEAGPPPLPVSVSVGARHLPDL